VKSTALLSLSLILATVAGVFAIWPAVAKAPWQDTSGVEALERKVDALRTDIRDLNVQVVALAAQTPVPLFCPERLRPSRRETVCGRLDDLERSLANLQRDAGQLDLSDIERRLRDVELCLDSPQYAACR
jgi:hypothetical protein